MPLQVKDPTDIQSAYDELGDPHTKSALSDAEARGSDAAYVDSGLDQLEAYANDPANSTAKEVGAREGSQSANSAWVDNTSKTPKVPGLNRGQKFARIAKKGGPFGLIVSVLLGGAGMVSFFGGPGLLIVNFAEVITDKLNYQLGVMDARYTKIVESKLKNSTKGWCTTATSRLCKYSTFSDKEIANFKEAGKGMNLKVNESGTSISGRTKIDSFEIEVDGVAKKITASEFKSSLKSIPEFGNAMKSAYNMKYIGTSDSIFSKMLTHFKTSKTRPFTDADNDEGRATEMQEKAKNGSQEADLGAADVCDKAGECDDTEKARNASGANNASEAVENASSNNDSVANRVLAEAGDVATEGTQEAVEEVAEKAAKVGAKAAWDAGSSTIKITGLADNVCMVYGWVKGFSFAAKAIRAAQIARYAMMFLSTASMIKAGVAEPEDVNYLGNLMTKVTTTDGKKTKAATDSIGYRSLAFGDTGATTSSLNAVAGASFPAFIQGAIDIIINSIGKKGIDQTCHVLANPFVQAGSLLVGIASFFVGVGEVKFTAQMAIAPVIALIGAFLPTMLGEILAGKVVTSSTYGEVTGDLISSGTGGMLSKSSSLGGGSILKRGQAKAYLQHQSTVAAEYAEYERQTTSPFDASNPNTFLGSIYTQLTPYLSQASSVTGAISSIGSIVLSSMSNIVSPKTSAADMDTSACTDMAIVDLDMATDIFCNPVTGIPTEYLSAEPNDIFERLNTAGLVDAEGNPQGSYNDFITNCIEREAPYGVSNADQVDNTADCFIDSQTKADMYLFRADGRVIGALEEESTSGTPATTPTPSGKCPSGTTKDYGTQKGYDNGKETDIATCGIIDWPASFANSAGDKIVEVNATIAEDTVKLAQALKETGYNYTASIGFRTNEQQACIYKQYTSGKKGCSPFNTRPSAAAKPGYSNHQMGLSIDIDGSKGTKLGNWLDDHMKEYGFSRDVYNSSKTDYGHMTHT